MFLLGVMGIYWGYIRVILGFMGIMKKLMDTTIMGDTGFSYKRR